MREIDLKNINIRTDLISEVHTSKSKGIKVKTKDYGSLFVENIKVEKINDINKKEGNYTTITFTDITDTDNFDKLKCILKKELKKYIKKNKTLVIGLGNSNSTPDSLGPNTVDNILVTSYLEEFRPLEKGFSSVSILKPGVTGQTGIETLDMIKAVVKIYKPKQVIIIDALASKSASRVCKTIQITNTGISPGSGVGNNRGEISFKTLKVPVVAIGVPTVVDALNIVIDVFNYLKKYINNDLLGIIGVLKENEIKELINDISSNLMVTPKEIDFEIKKLSELISSSLNEVLHSNIENKKM